MATSFINKELSRIKNKNPIMNKIGKEIYVNWIIENLIKTKKIKLVSNSSKININLKKILDKKYFEIFRYEVELNSHIKDLFEQIAIIEKNTDVIANNIIYRLFNTIEAQENIGFIRESRYTFERISKKIDNLNYKNFIENKISEKENINEIIKVYDYIYKNEIHKKILEYNENINKRNLEKTIKLLRTIPFIDEYKIFNILIDLGQYSFYKFNEEDYIYLRKKVIYTLKELFDKYDELEFEELYFWLYKNTKNIIKEFYDIELELKIYDLDIVLYDLSFIIKRIYNDCFDGEFLLNIDMASINPQHRSKNSEEYHVKMADGRCLEF